MADDEDILCADGVPHDLHILRRLIFCIILPEMLWLLVFFYFYSYYSVYTIFTLDDKQSFTLLWSHVNWEEFQYLYVTLGDNMVNQG